MPDRTKADILDHEYLEIRAKILQIAASFDRMERADDSTDERTDKLEAGIEILLDDQPDKARRVQELFSREYQEGWRSKFGI